MAPAETDGSAQGMQRYYAARAPEYDLVYEKPERQADIALLQAELPRRFEGLRVLEVACGTGFWTQFIAPAAKHVLALDASPETMAIAQQRVAPDRVTFREGDAYALPEDWRGLDAAFAGFWFSHVPIARRREFLQGLHCCLAPGARVLLIDNQFVAGSNHAISEIDAAGDSYQARRLADGSTHRVLKNFPSREELVALIDGMGRPLPNPTALAGLSYYWCFEYQLPG
ncbi:methyltransferase domain-containing protein [Ideonella azotifigens]|uniref:Methyltransferase domain-containing protein n=1 Tax=Ideonella azotifigens TaxID=513160 RepID=A0ABN1JLG4_9BURK|nr:class I SAM-dependent methyltransferase [Ideonella azotifigens]MCD2339722.1 methyltransferase domain-containing protein [Ideonella azotifigens]